MLLLSLSLFLIVGERLGAFFLLGAGRFLHLYGYQSADADAEQLALTEQLFDAALGELSVVARGQPCLLVGDFNVEPTKIPCLAKGISAGLWVDFEEAWALATGLQPAPTCKRSWAAIEGTLLLVVLLLPLLFFLARFSLIGGLLSILRYGLFFDCCRWESQVTQPVQRTHFWPASWLPANDKSRVSKSVEVQSVWEIYDEVLQFMSRQDASLLDESLESVVVSLAWLVWSGLGLLRLHLLMLLGSVVVLFPQEVWFLAGVVLLFALLGLVVIEFAKLGLMLLMLLRLLMFSCIVTPLLLLCLI